MPTSNMSETETKLFKTISEIAEKNNTPQTKIINQTIEIFKTINEILEKDNKPAETKAVIELLETALEFKRKNEKKNDFLKMGGIFTTDKPFNAVEDRKKMRNGEL